MNYPPPNPIPTPNDYNYNYFTNLEDNLTLEAADKRYLKLSGGSVGYLNVLTDLNVFGNYYLNSVLIDFSALAVTTKGIAEADKCLIVDSNRDISNINSLSATSITALNSLEISGSGHLTVSASSHIKVNNTNDYSFTTDASIYSKGGIWLEKSLGCVDVIASGNLKGNSLYLAGTQITSNATELNYNDIAAVGVGQANKTLVLDGNKDITGINSLSSNKLIAVGGTGNSLELCQLLDDNIPVAYDRFIRLGKNSTANNHGLISFYFGSSGGTNNRLRFGFSTPGYILNITSGGDVGINTATPSYKLDVNGSFRCTSFYISNTQVTATANELNILDGVTATTAELNYNDITAVGVGQANKTLVLDASRNISNINKITLNTTAINWATVISATNSTVNLELQIGLTESFLGCQSNHNTVIMSNNSRIITCFTNGHVDIGGSTDTGYKLNISSGGTINSYGYYLEGSLINVSYITEITEGTASANKALVLDSSLNISGINNLSTTGINTFSNTTDSTGTNTGALVISGGVGIAKKLYVGELIRTVGNVGIGTFPNYKLDLGATSSDRLINLYYNGTSGTSFYGLGANSNVIKILSSAGAIFYAGSTNLSTGSAIATISTSGLSLPFSGNLTLNNTNDYDSTASASIYSLGGAYITGSIQCSTTMNMGYSGSLVIGGGAGSTAIPGRVWSFLNYGRTPVLYYDDTLNSNADQGVIIGWGGGNNFGRKITISHNKGTFLNTKLIVGNDYNSSNTYGQLHIVGGVSMTVGSSLTTTLTPSRLDLGQTATYIDTTGVYCEQALKVGSRGIYVSSDRRIKTNIKNLPENYGIDFIKNIEPVYYHLKENTNGRPYIGYIAQELYKNKYGDLVDLSENPELEEEDEYSPKGIQLSVNYQRTGVIVHHALKESIKKIEELENRIMAIEELLNL